MIITIDGYSATGKSTIAELLAQKLAYTYINTGLFYRYVTYVLIENDITGLNDEAKIKDLIDTIEFDEELFSAINLKTSEINRFGPQIAKCDFVRISINRKIYSIITQKSNLVIEGRDIGTELFPNAEKKFFFIADLDIRAMRLLKDRPDTTLEILKKELVDRDNIDETRSIAPLRASNDAIIIDTTNCSIEELVLKLETYIYGE